MIGDFGPAISLVGSSFELWRRPKKALVNGRRRDTEPERLGCITGSLQNPSDNDLEMLPEAQRLKEVRTLYTTRNLEIGGAGSDYEADRLKDTLTGKTYEVMALRDWGFAGNYHRYLVERLGQ